MVVSVAVASILYLQRSSASDGVLLNQTVDSASPKPGDIVNFTITYSNPSLSPAYNLTVFEWLPSRLVFITSRPFYDGVSMPEAGFLRWSRGDVVPGGSGSIVVRTMVGNATVGTVITNTVHLTYEDGQGGTFELTASASITVAHGAGVSVFPDQIHGIQPSTNAETSYNITILNTGNAPDVFDISLASLAYDPNLSGGNKYWQVDLYNSTGFLIATRFDDVSESPSSWTYWGTLATVSLGAGESARFVIRVVEPGGTSGSGDAYFKVSLTATSQFDPSITSTALTITVVRKAVGISISPDYEREAAPGETVTYLHEVFNGGGFGGSDQTVVIDLTYSSSQGWPYYFFFANGTVLHDTNNDGLGDVGPLTKDSSINILFRVTVPYGTPAGVVDHAIITATGETNGKTYIDTASDTTTVMSAPLVGVTKKLVSANPAYIGDLVTYWINVTNLGNTKLVNVPLDDAFNTSCLDYSSASMTPDSISEVAGTIHWDNLTSLQPLQSAIVTVNITATDGDSAVRESANVIDAEDEFGQLISAIYLNTELRIVRLVTLTVTAAPSEALGGNFDIAWTEHGVTHSSTFTTPADVVCDVNTLATISNPQQYIVVGDVRYAFDNYSLSSPILVQSDMVAVLNYRVQYRVTFTQTGLDSTASGAVVIVDEEQKTYADLPFTTDWLDSGTSLSFEYSSMVSSSVAGKQFRLNSVDETSPLSVTQPMTVTGNYVTQYLVTFDHTGLDGTALGTVVTVNGTLKQSTDLPYSTWVDSGTSVEYSYEALVSSSITGKRFRLESVSGPESPITITEPVLVTGNYVTQYYLTVVSPYGTTGGSDWYDQGAAAYATVDPLTVSGPSGIQYVFTNWSGDASGATSSSDPITMDAPKTATANWKTQYYLTVVSAYDSPTPTSGWFDDGTLIDVSVTSPWAGDTGMQYVCTGWTGTGSVPPSGTEAGVSFTIEEPSSITWNCKTQYLVTFGQTGLDDSSVGTVVTVDSEAKTFGNLPFSKWVDSGNNVTYAYETVVSRNIEGKQFKLIDVTGPTTPITVTEPTAITGNYVGQYLVTFTYTGLDASATGTVVTVDGSELSFGDLPFSKWVDTNQLVYYEYESIILSSEGGKRFRFDSITGPDSPINVTASVTVYGNYVVQYYLTVDTNPAEVSSLNSSAVSGQGWYDSGTNATVDALQLVDKVAGESRYDFRSWTGAEPTSEGNEGNMATVHMDGLKTATANYQLQYSVTISQAGVSSDFEGTVVNVDGEEYDVSNLSAQFWWDDNSPHSFAFVSPLSVDTGKQYRWSSTDGLSNLQSDILTITGAGSVTGNYVTQYLVTFTQTGIDSSANATIVMVDDSPKGFEDLTFSEWVDENSAVTYTYESLVTSSATGKRFNLTDTAGPLSPITVIEPVTVTGNYVIQYRVIFAQTGLSSDATGTVVTVNGNAKTLSNLQFEMWVDTDSQVSYSYEAIVSSTTANKQYRFDGVTGPASPVTVTSAITVTGKYVTQYLITFAQTGLEGTSTGNVVTVDGNAKTLDDLPFIMWVDSGNSVVYSYVDPVSSSMAGKRFALVNVTGSVSPITVTEPVAVTGNYKIQYYLTMSTNYGTVSPNSGWYDANSHIDISAFPPSVLIGERYVWLGWTGTSDVSYTGMDNPASVTMNSPITETASWRHEYFLTVTSAHDTPTPTSGWFEAGTGITASVTSPWAGDTGTQYVCTGWTGLGSVPASGTYTALEFVINSPSSMAWNWKTQYYLTMVTNFGTVSPGDGWHDEGSLVQISAAPPETTVGNGYVWHGWTGTGTVSYTGLDNPANITMNSPITETAYWKISPELTITISEETVARCNTIIVNGTTTPATANTEIDVTYTFPNGTEVTHTVLTDTEGRYSDTLDLGNESIYGIFTQDGTWTITANRPGDVSKESASDSATMGIQAAGVYELPLVAIALAIIAAAIAFYLVILDRVNKEKLPHKTWWHATVILGIGSLIIGIASLALIWTSSAGTALINGKPYTANFNLNPFSTASVSITDIPKYLGTEIPSLINSAWSGFAKSPGPVLTLLLAPAGCILTLACLYKPRSERQKTVKVATLLLAGALIMVPVAQGLMFVYVEATTIGGIATGFGAGLCIAVLSGILAIMAGFFATRETPITSAKQTKPS